MRKAQITRTANGYQKQDTDGSLSAGKIQARTQGRRTGRDAVRECMTWDEEHTFAQQAYTPLSTECPGVPSETASDAVGEEQASVDLDEIARMGTWAF